jgi:DNA repair exonuclease SbcCD ATPase subunit
LNYFNYFSEIESAFIRRRGRNLLLSPLDWALIETWQEREVPLHVILRGIERVFDGVDKQPARKRTIKSLMYCREEIEAQYAEWLESQIGKIPTSKFQILNSETDKENSTQGELFSNETIAAHLEKVTDELKSAKNESKGELSKILEKVVNRLMQLRGKISDVETLENDLEKLDALIDDSLLQNFSNEKVKSEIKKEIASYKNKMDDETYQRTYNLMLLKRLREQAEIPRLSLFYL